MKIISENEGIKVQSTPACYLCGTEGHLLYGSLRDRLFAAPGEWSLKECPNAECGLIWLDPMPTEADISKVYTTYYTHQVNTCERTNIGVWSILWRKLRTARKLVYLRLMSLTSLHEARFSIATMYLAHNKPGKLLEVGCGTGIFLDRMRSRGWDVQGLEVDPEASKIAEATFGVPVFAGTLEEANYPNANFDAVTMNHVIEHVHDPATLLLASYRVLKQGGCLVVVTPNIKSFGHNRFGQNWRDLDPPRHLHLFSRSTLESIAKKAGFQKTETWTTPANAEVIALGSIDIQLDGKHAMGSSPSLLRELICEGFQLGALIYYQKHPGSGEEVVLKACK
jgi:2-polyprenyl-3-methyl-5-hydroxy-6-metoxy-1,4-benzoquinol methylase